QPNARQRCQRIASELRRSFDEVFENDANAFHVGADVRKISMLLVELLLELRNSGELSIEPLTHGVELIGYGREDVGSGCRRSCRPASAGGAGRTSLALLPLCPTDTTHAATSPQVASHSFGV